MHGIEIRSLTKLYAVLLLSERNMHGYEIMKEIGNKLGRKPSPGQIYPFLRQLEQHCYISSKGRSEREKKVYQLTPEGKKFLSALSDRLGEVLEIAVKRNLTKCAHCECEIYKGGVREKINGRYLDFCCRNCAKAYVAMKK
ncbi:MAG: PadR family transcriptional regulator [Candidatus Micrarchaeota archaeon]|nr:PadR family transcriptional regulator [Candidatus Micrarchaeota archaeon]MDE1849464.1 PadR family transcriptional regulator [Candidatus Micrarchaeota archaeon]